MRQMAFVTGWFALGVASVVSSPVWLSIACSIGSCVCFGFILFGSGAK